MRDGSIALSGEATIAEALTYGAARLTSEGIETARLDARVLLKHILKADDAGLIVRAREALCASARQPYLDCLDRRCAREPVAYITGVKEFWSLEFTVSPDTLIPRDDSECLIEAACARRSRDSPLRIADLGTGSGCLLCALLQEFPQSVGVGVDISPAALAVARANALALGFADRAQFMASDWMSALEGEFDIIIANPPYIAETARDSLAHDVVGYEPSGALFGGGDGYDAYRALIGQIPRNLAGNGLLILECGDTQASDLAAMLGAEAPEATLFTISDLGGRPRGVGADWRKSQKRD